MSFISSERSPFQSRLNPAGRVLLEFFRWELLGRLQYLRRRLRSLANIGANYIGEDLRLETLLHIIRTESRSTRPSSAWRWLCRHI